MRADLINIAFCRALLTRIVPIVRKVGKRVNKDAWVWHDGHKHWEFHGPDGKIDWYGGADNAYEARYKGWCAWLQKNHPEVMQ